MAAARAAFAAAVRVIYRIHRCTAHSRPSAHPARTARFADDDQTMFFVGCLADRCPCRPDYLTHFARRHFEMRISCVLRYDLGEITGGTRDFTAIPRFELNVVDECADRNVCERQAIACFYGSRLGNNKCIAD